MKKLILLITILAFSCANEKDTTTTKVNVESITLNLEQANRLAQLPLRYINMHTVV